MNVTVKNIPDDVLQDLKRAAQSHGRSLNSLILALMEDEAENERRRAKMRRKREQLESFVAGLPETESSAELIREDRDR
jgi:plasmid stability protein